VGTSALRVTWYRFATTFGRRWTGYLSLVLLIGLLGGIGMASVAAARRTQSSFATFLAHTNPSDLSVSINDAPVLTKELERLPRRRASRGRCYVAQRLPADAS
jgi:hypothetical protein